MVSGVSVVTPTCAGLHKTRESEPPYNLQHTMMYKRAIYVYLRDMKTGDLQPVQVLLPSLADDEEEEAPPPQLSSSKGKRKAGPQDLMD